LGTIGKGAYGNVQKVLSRKTGQVFAMKTIPKGLILKHKLGEYLAREVATQLQLQHPFIIRLHQHFEDADSFRLLLEYAPGGNLFAALRKRGRLPEAEAARAFASVAAALDHLHGHGIAHRDVKPENVLLSEGGVAKLADFGWCAELAEGGRNTFCGTLDYLSPEMVESEPHDAAVDLWAMGVLLFEMLVGRPPFAAKSQVASVARIVKVDLQIPEELDPLAADLIRKLLVRLPRERMPLCEALQHPWVRQHTRQPEPRGSCASTESRSSSASVATQPVAAGTIPGLHLAMSPTELERLPRGSAAATWRETETYEAVRAWVRKGSGARQSLVSELDATCTDTPLRRCGWASGREISPIARTWRPPAPEPSGGASEREISPIARTWRRQAP